VLAILKRVPDRVEQALYLQQLARLVNVEERTLADALAHAPVVRRPTRAVDAGSRTTEPQTMTLGTLESQALELMLRYPALAAELPADEPMPFRDAVAVQLATVLRERAVARMGDGAPPVVTDESAELGTFVSGLDPATGALARELLAAAAAGRDEPVLDPVAAREVLRTCLLRLKAKRLHESIEDANQLLDDAQRNERSERVRDLQQALNGLREQLNDVMHEPATVAGTRR
jgi:hypothetical protein